MFVMKNQQKIKVYFARFDSQITSCEGKSVLTQFSDFLRFSVQTYHFRKGRLENNGKHLC
jgi:hypothetical protein